MKWFICMVSGGCLTVAMLYFADWIGVSYLIISFLIYNRFIYKEENEKVRKELNEIKITLDEIRKGRE